MQSTTRARMRMRLWSCRYGASSTYCDVALENVQQLVGPVRNWVPLASHLVGAILGHLRTWRVSRNVLGGDAHCAQMNAMGDHRFANSKRTLKLVFGSNT